MRKSVWLGAMGAAMLLCVGVQAGYSQKADTAGKETILKATDVTPKIMPEKVFFRGQTASVQMRNTGGVHYGDDFYVVTGLVDNSGYSTGIKEKYQAYLITEVPLDFGGQVLKPGAYGFGFIDNNKVIVMDLGGNDLFTTGSTHDAEIKRPVPLQVAEGKGAGNYRLYKGRDFVDFHRTK